MGIFALFFFLPTGKKGRGLRGGGGDRVGGEKGQGGAGN